LWSALSRSLDDLRESGNESNDGDDNENDLSFDVENTLLTVAPSDVSELGGTDRGRGGGLGSLHHHRHHHVSSSSPVLPAKDNFAIREQLGMCYFHYYIFIYLFILIN
jgi:hypothetical protein